MIGPNDPHDCRLYWFKGRDPHERGIGDVMLYIGETAREPFERMMEHVYTKGWKKDITSWGVYPEVYPNKAAVLRAEKAKVEAELPIYNDEWNRGNPWRIPIYKQGSAPRLRQPFREPHRPKSAARQKSKRRTADPAPPRWLGGVVATVIVWMVLAGVLWWTRADEWLGWDGPKYGAMSSTAVVVGVWLLARPKRRRRGRR